VNRWCAQIVSSHPRIEELMLWNKGSSISRAPRAGLQIAAS
jgi:hypothetical protein